MIYRWYVVKGYLSDAPAHWSSSFSASSKVYLYCLEASLGNAQASQEQTMVNFPFINRDFAATDSFLSPIFAALRILRIRHLFPALVRCRPNRSTQ